MKSLTITLIIFEFGVLSIVIDLATADCQPMTVQNPKLGRYDISADGCQHCDDEYTLCAKMGLEIKRVVQTDAR